MDNFKIIDLFEKVEVDELVSQFGECSWRSGSLNGGHPYKLNAEMLREGLYGSLDQKIANTCITSKEITNFTFATSLTKTIFSRTGVGGQYPLHNDSGSLGHYSMTTFLCEPDEYDGGELNLCLNGSIEKFKLGKGKSIVYSTGVPHSVGKVTRGERIVAVNWIVSGYADQDIRNCMRNLGKMMSYFDKFGEDTSEFSYEEMMDHPHFLLQNTIAGFERRFHTNKSRGID